MNDIRDINIEKLSCLKKIDKKSLLSFLDRYLISYRKSLNLDNNISFGTEIEYEMLDENIVSDFCSNKLEIFNPSVEITVLHGGEVVSEILYDTEYTWESLKKMCLFLKENNATNMYGTSGAHIHIGANIISSYDSLELLLKSYFLYEDILTRFFYGDKINGRKAIKKYAKVASRVIFEVLENNYNYKLLHKNSSLSLSSFDIESIRVKNNTIELRTPNGTLEEVIWQNNINAIIKMILKTEKDIDKEFIEYKYQKEKGEILKQKPITFNNIKIDKALEFIDLFYDNNLDKINFLKQYIKDNKVSYDDRLILSKKFWK